MAGIDTSQGKLAFPPRFVPYLEKHRIFELFHELAELLVQDRPKDHVKFLKDVLPCAAKRRDKPRVVFLAPPSFDRVGFAKEIGRILGIPGIDRFHLEMKAREARMLEKLRRQGVEKKMLVPEEEYPCICPGEYEPGEYETSYRPPSFFEEESEPEKQSVPEQKKSSSSSVEEGEAEEEEDPCKGLRICSCKDGQLEITGNEENNEERASERSKNTENGDAVTDLAPVASIPASSEKVHAEGREEKGARETSESSRLSSCVCESSEETVVDFRVLGKCEYSENGWILIDFPVDAEEAELMSEQGALPTHAVRIITGEGQEKDREYKYLSKDWATVYKCMPVTDVHVNGRSIPQLAESVARLLRSMPHRHAPMLPRIALIGSRGSGASTQAKLLSRKYKLVHVDFEEEMARYVLQDDKYSETYKRQLLTRPDPELEAAILEKILISAKHQKRGWVLTGYPTNIDQLRMLDLMATPPNRIIFVEVPAKECFVRLYYRKTDWADGKEYKLPAVEPAGLEARDGVGLEPEARVRLMAHPKDDKRLIIRDIEGYFEEKDEMMKYCGKTAAYVNGNKCVESVFEQIDQIIINPSPAEPPRDPLALGHGIEEAYERLKSMRTERAFTSNNLMVNPPDPLFEF